MRASAAALSPIRKRKMRKAPSLVSIVVVVVGMNGSTDAFVTPTPTNAAAAAATARWKQIATPRKRSLALQSAAPPEKQTTKLPDYGKTSVEIETHHLKKKNQWRRLDLDGSSLIEQTLQEMENDVDFQQTLERQSRLGTDGMTKEERARRRRALDDLGIPSFRHFVASQTDAGHSWKRGHTEVLQLNIGLYCNQACAHCHVESSPLRTEMMTTEIATRCLELLKRTPSITTLDITGGAPELNSQFRYLVSMARSLFPDLEIIDRCNLTVLQEPGQDDLVEFLAQHRVRIVASLPCYSANNVDKQRGNGVFERSIAALLALNEAGYGQPASGLHLDLVYNPLGAFLPPPQAKLQTQYQQQLEDNFGILFTQLFTMTNMPIKRFADFLHRRDELHEYMQLLVRNFNTETLPNLMCKNTASVGYDGKLYDCDFNQQLGISIGNDKTVFDIESLDDLMEDTIATDNHCFGCTAGMGSS